MPADPGGRLLLVGLDCLGPELLAPERLAELPALRSVCERGTSGPLRSTVPAITVPAWTSMLSGRDPGELGVYGFRNRRSSAYGDLAYAASTAVRAPRLWDHAGAAGGRSIVVGAPQTFPAAALRGELVAGFEAHGAPLDAGARVTHPPALAAEVARVAPGYAFDAGAFRQRDRRAVLAEVVRMTERRFDLVEHLLDTRPWRLAVACEIGPDRVHHLFWRDHDPAHPRHDPASPDRDVVASYHRLLDARLARLLERVGPRDTVIVASDHGAQPMRGGVLVNELLREAGWLVLRERPSAPVPLRPELVDWSRTRAWGEGGHYARVFLNVRGREPQGVVEAGERDRARAELAELLATLRLPGAPRLDNEVVWPERAYRRVRGLAPDLLVVFAGMAWRSLGSVGHGRLWLAGDDRGADDANHSEHGLYAIAGPGVARGAAAEASILDVAPTALAALGLRAPGDLSGRSLLDRPAAEAAA